MKKVQIIEKSCHREGLKVQRMRDFFLENGYELIENDYGIDPTNRYAFPLQDLQIDQEADLLILTTCGFTKAIEDGDFEAIKIINEHKKETARVIVAGCLTEISPERLAREFDGPSFDNRSYHKLDELVEHRVAYNDIPAQNKLKNTDNFFISIQEGCDHRCSYCAIWRTIGKSVSKPMEEILKEFKEGLANGYKHFYLLGHCSGAYGRDHGSNLSALLKEFIHIDGDYDILLEDVMPLYFLKIAEELKILARQKKIRSFHTPIQSGNDRILTKMKRRCDMNKVKENLLALRENNPDIVLSSSVIVGFPTETREELQDTIRFCQEATFNSAACHMFSARPGSEAMDMEGQFETEEIAERYQIFQSSFDGATRIDPNQRQFVEVGSAEGVL